MLSLLCEEDTLRVFAAIVMSTGTGEPRSVPSPSGSISLQTTHITPTGVSRATGLPVEVAREALLRLELGGLARSSDQGGCWRTNLPAISKAAAEAR